MAFSRAPTPYPHLVNEYPIQDLGANPRNIAMASPRQPTLKPEADDGVDEKDNSPHRLDTCLNKRFADDQRAIAAQQALATANAPLAQAIKQEIEEPIVGTQEPNARIKQEFEEPIDRIEQHINHIEQTNVRKAPQPQFGGLALRTKKTRFDHGIAKTTPTTTYRLRGANRSHHKRYSATHPYIQHERYLCPVLQAKRPCACCRRIEAAKKQRDQEKATRAALAEQEAKEAEYATALAAYYQAAFQNAEPYQLAEPLLEDFLLEDFQLEELRLANPERFNTLIDQVLLLD